MSYAWHMRSRALSRHYLLHALIQMTASAECTLHSHIQQVYTAELDWTANDHGLGKFDVVIACDVLYEREAIQPVAELAIKLMANKGARFILADPENRTRAHRYSQLATAAALIAK